MTDRNITIFHSPDADDAFMFYGLAGGHVVSPGYKFSHELCDIESLNHRALKGELEVTAVSVHAFSYLKDRYSIMRYGASMGGVNYGPRLVVKAGLGKSLNNIKTVAIPGELTSAALAFKIYMREHSHSFELINIRFDEVQHAVLSGEIDGGIIIHEGQLTHSREGLESILDLGQWWWQATSLPLPLGINIVRNDLGPEATHAAALALRDSINFSLSHRQEALDYALTYGRGITRGEADEFVGMYVNERTVDIGQDGMRSIMMFLAKGREYGITPKEFDESLIKFVE
jgi:1,4-dihydroxy-6-naphthoate synthase